MSGPGEEPGVDLDAARAAVFARLDAGWDRRQAEACAAYEESAAGELLKLVGRGDLAGPLRAEARGCAPGGRLTLAAVLEALEGFPARLAAPRLRFTAPSDVASLFNEPGRMAMYDAWCELAEEAGPGHGGAALGLVFAWPAVRRGGRFMVFHDRPDLPLADRVDPDGVALTVPIRARPRPGVYAIERLASLVRRLGAAP